MRSIGFEEGRNLTIEWRFAGGKEGDIQTSAQDLVRLNVELIVADNNEAIGAVSQATRTLPIIMWFGVNPVENGWIKNLSRPGGNITGTTWTDPGMFGKTLQIIKEAAPAAKRIAMMWNPTFPFEALWRADAIQAAQALGMEPQFFFVRKPEDIHPALNDIAANLPDAFFAAVERIMQSAGREIAAFAVDRKLVSVSNSYTMVLDGLLLYYGPQRPAVDRRMASIVERILLGATPAEVPVERPTTYELVINGKTARAIGHKIPQSLLLRADRVIE